MRAQSKYLLVYDSSLSPMMGSEIITSCHFIFSETENKYLQPHLFKNPNKKFGKGMLNGIYRFGKTVIIDATKVDFLRVFQHEVFGHGSRLREFGYTKNRFQISFPSGGGLTSYGTAPQNRIKTLEEEIMIRLGGSESTMLLSNKIRNNWLATGMINISEAHLYASSFISFTRGINNTDIESATLSNDIYNFYLKMNQLNGINVAETPFTVDYLKKRALINYLNPLQYYALLTLLKDYIVLGKEEVKLPMIQIGKYEYLPLFRMNLSPFGTELYLENFLRSDQSLNTLYIRLGDRVFGEQHVGIGLKKTNVYENDWLNLDLELDIWKQPDMALGGKSVQLKEEGIGGAFKGGLSVKLFKGDHASSIYGLFGYKSAGYLEGEYLEQGFFSRIGLMLMK